MAGRRARSWHAQMPFANFTVGQVFFAVVHDQLRPSLDAFAGAMEAMGEERPALEAYVALVQRCWSNRSRRAPPKFKEARAF